jgi:hypothetical protein
MAEDTRFRDIDFVVGLVVTMLSIPTDATWASASPERRQAELYVKEENRWPLAVADCSVRGAVIDEVVGIVVDPGECAIGSGEGIWER